MSQQVGKVRVRLEPWREEDLDLLRRINSPEMKRHLGGSESDEQVITRHRRYLDSNGTASPMFRIVVLPEEVAVGSIGFWERDWRDDRVYETGWSVVPEYQGRGIAVAATGEVIVAARAAAKHRHLHAFPSVDNPPSNAICRKAGFTFVAACDFEYPPGHTMRCNDWRLDLFAR